MPKTLSFLLVPVAIAIHSAAYAHTFNSLTEYTPPYNLNAPIGVADDGRVVGHGACLSYTSYPDWCRTPEGEISFYWTPEDGFEQIDWNYESAAGFDSNQSMYELKIVDASANLDYLVGTYSVSTVLSPTSYINRSARAFRWSEAGGFEVLWPHDESDGLFPQSVSADGETFAGFVGDRYGNWQPRYINPQRPGGRAVRWTSTGGVEELGVPSFAEGSIATLVSADGSAIAGMVQSFGGIVMGFRWTESGGVVALGDLPGGAAESGPKAISADGNVIVGYSKSTVGDQPFRWDATNGMVGLGFLSTSERSYALAVSADGNVIAGYATDFRDGNTIRVRNEAWIWTSEGGMRSLGFLPGGDPGFEQSIANYVSPDGSVVIGSSTSAQRPGCSYGCEGEDIFIWTEATGMLGLRDILTAHGYDLSDWNTVGLAGVRQVSPNANAIAVGALHVEPFQTTPPSPYAAYIGYYDSYSRGFAVQFDRIAAKIDVAPWSPLNQVDPNAAGNTLVALLARTGSGALDSSFDISKINAASLRFGPGEAPVALGPLSGVDFDADSNPDVAYGFNTFDAAIECGDTEVVLQGETTDGEAFIAKDSIETIDCQTSTCHP